MYTNGDQRSTVYFYYKPITCVLFFKKVAFYPMLCPFLVLVYKKKYGFQFLLNY